jgi:membrane protein implicated in regulation of membrane protease activity
MIFHITALNWQARQRWGKRMPDTQDVSLLPLGWTLVLILLFMVLCVWAIVKISEANEKRALSPQEKLIGELGRVLSPITPHQPGKVKVFGETWDALPENSADSEPIAPQTEVRIVGIDAVDPKILRVARLLR